MDTSQITNLLIWIIFAFLIFFMSSYILLSIFIYKENKIKEDCYTCEKNAFQILVFLYLIISAFNKLIEVGSVSDIEINITKYVIMGYFSTILIYNLLIEWESYKAIRDPSFVFRSYI